MLELPEAYTLSKQIEEKLHGRSITQVIANQSPHGFAFFHGPPEGYPSLLEGTTIQSAESHGGQVQINLDSATLLFNDGTNLRYLAPGDKRPAKHQLLLELDDGSAIVVTVQMYGGLVAVADVNAYDNGFYTGAVKKPSPLSDAFDKDYFMGLFEGTKPKLSAKAFLATEQRIPGLGNGVLQDILFLSGIHPARPMSTLDEELVDTMFRNVKDTLGTMTENRGRDTEKDFYGNDGGYRTLLSRKTAAYPCPKCGAPIVRKAYLGGNVYFCPVCQPLIK